MNYYSKFVQLGQIYFRLDQYDTVCTNTLKLTIGTNTNDWTNVVGIYFWIWLRDEMYSFQPMHVGFSGANQLLPCLSQIKKLLIEEY